MSAFENVSFEIADNLGNASGWTWNRSVGFHLMGFSTGAGAGRFEGFEVAWGSDPFVGSLVVPSSAIALVFDPGGSRPLTTETFERSWLQDETAFFVWDAGSAAVALFNGTLGRDDFEEGWSADESFSWAFTSGQLAAAEFGANAFDPFEVGWKSNDTYLFALGSTDSALFRTNPMNNLNVEGFEAVAPDQPATFTPASLISVPAQLLPSIGGSYPPDFQLTLYNAGGGALPPEIDPRRTYFMLQPLLSGGLGVNVSTAISGSALVFSAASGNNWIKLDTRYFWTLTDVGI